MTGGISGGMEARSHKWDDKAIDGLLLVVTSIACWVSFYYLLILLCAFPDLKKRKDQYESEIEGLGTLRELQMKESDASEKVSGLERKIHYATIEEVTIFVCNACLSPP